MMLKKDGQYVEIDYGNVYDHYRVLQRKWIHIDGENYSTTETATVYADKWIGFYYDVIKT